MEMDFCPCWGFQLDTEMSELWVGRSRQPWGATARVASESPRSGQPPGTTSLLSHKLTFPLPPYREQSFAAFHIDT